MSTVFHSNSNSFSLPNNSNLSPLDSYMEEQVVDDISQSSSFNQESTIDCQRDRSFSHGRVTLFPSSPSFNKWSQPSLLSASSMPAKLCKHMNKVANPVACISPFPSSKFHANLAFGKPDFAPQEVDLPWLPAADGSMEDIITDQEIILLPASCKKVPFLPFSSRKPKNGGCVIFPWMCDSEIV